jgi:L-fuculose-phosphate aldolase
MNKQFSFTNSISKEEFLRYAKFLVQRGYVQNTLGNIAVRSSFGSKPVILTKRRGCSLQEMDEDDIVATSLNGQQLIHGSVYPSIGHQMAVEVLRNRQDINAIIHIHVNDIIAFFLSYSCQRMPYISIDTPLITGSDVIVLDKEINVEVQSELISEFIGKTNVFIMKNHGLTALGRTLSEAFHRTNSVVAEVQRLAQYLLFCSIKGILPQFLSDEEVNSLYSSADDIIYGITEGTSPEIRE